MENNTQLNAFEEVPNSFLTELSEEQFLTEVKSTAKDAPDKDALQPSLDINFNSIESHGIGDNISTPLMNANSVSISNFLNEDLGTDIYEAILITIALTVLDIADIEMKKSELQFSANEKKTLKPIIKQCLEQMDIKFTNPFEALFWTSGILIASKIFVEKGDDIMMKFTGAKKKSIKKEEVKKETSKEGKPLSKYMLAKQNGTLKIKPKK